MKIRKAKLNDVDAMCHLNSLLNQCHAELGAFWTLKEDSRSLREMCRQYFRKMIRSRLAILLVAEDNGTLVGYIHGTLKPRPPIFQISVIGQLNSIYVLASYRRRGIGKQLIDALIDWFQSKQIAYVEVNSEVRNSIALTVWKKYGFQQTMINLRLSLPRVEDN